MSNYLSQRVNTFYIWQINDTDHYKIGVTYIPFNKEIYKALTSSTGRIRAIEKPNKVKHGKVFAWRSNIKGVAYEQELFIKQFFNNNKKPLYLLRGGKTEEFLFPNINDLLESIDTSKFQESFTKM